MQLQKELGVLAADEQARQLYFAARMHALLDGAENLSAAQNEAQQRREALDASGKALAQHLEHAMDFVRQTFGAGHELLIFLTQLKLLPGADGFLKASEQYRALCAAVLPEEMEKHL